MATQYTWSIAQMLVYPEMDGQQNVIFNINWTLSGVDGDFQAFMSGSQVIEFDPSANFTPYNEITEEQAIGWILNSMTAEEISAYQAQIDEQISNQMSPPIINPPLPWA